MISAILVNFHSVSLIKKAVESLQQNNEDIEIILVDNTATNEERRRLNKILKDKKIKIFFNKKNEGFGRACNIAYDNSQGDFIFLLNPDAYLLPDTLCKLKEFLINTPQAGAVSPLMFWDNAMKYRLSILPLPSQLYDFLVKLAYFSKIIRKIFLIYERKKNLSLWNSSKPVKVKNLSGGIVMLRKSAIEKADYLFDKKYFLYYEDTDLFIRLRKAGCDLYMLPVAKAVHNSFLNKKKIDLMARSSCIYLKKHHRNKILQKITEIIPKGKIEKEHVNLGKLKSSPSFPVPPVFQKSFVFEFSPSPLFNPSVSCIGKGKKFILSREVWNQIDEGIYFCRITSREKLFFKHWTFSWIKSA